MNNRYVFPICALIVFSLIGSVFIQNAYGELTHVGIELSNSCLALIEARDFETCTSYDYLNYLYPDTKLKPSFQKLVDNAQQSERLKYQTNNIVLNHQVQCVLKDYCNIFEAHPKQTLFFWFNPHEDIRGKLDIKITIHPRLLPKNIIDVSESSAILYENGNRYATFEVKNLFIYPSCKTAEYDPITLYKELGRIIWYMLKDCKDPNLLGYIGDIYKVKITKNDFNINNSSQYQYNKWLKEAIANCKQKC